MRPWQEVAAEKVAIRDALIQGYSHSDKTVQAKEITRIDDIHELTRKLDDGKFTAEDVARAYILQ